jgi:hypothetical protein
MHLKLPAESVLHYSGWLLLSMLSYVLMPVGLKWMQKRLEGADDRTDIPLEEAVRTSMALSDRAEIRAKAITWATTFFVQTDADDVSREEHASRVGHDFDDYIRTESGSFFRPGQDATTRWREEVKHSRGAFTLESLI